MTTNTWSPESEKPEANFSIEQLLEIAQAENWLTTSLELNPMQIEWLRPLMHQPRDFWIKQCESLNEKELKQLIYFFTLLEESYNACESGNDSPVIALNKLLKKNNTPLNKDDLLWIKQNSRNKFLPNGSIF